jgi:NADPH:quinone reductase-like Zn-dependent oxidoreductase
MTSLGAEISLDYRDPVWREHILQWAPGGVDAVIAVQPDTSADSLPVVRDGGQSVSISGDPEVSDRGVRMSGLPYSANMQAETAQLPRDIAAGRLRVELERVYPFASASKALAKVQTRRARGKVVLTLY